jgi:hypothetical protein
MVMRPWESTTWGRVAKKSTEIKVFFIVLLFVGSLVLDGE